MDFVRTPDERFADLPGYDFEPHYEQVDGLRVHRVDEGPRDAAPVVMLHGEPTWSYLYRRMIPIVTAAGHRVVAPDLVGFGRSDKPTDRAVYSYAGHVDWLRTLLFDRLDLRAVTLVCQDWGGLLGLRLVAEHPERFARVVVANTLLPTGEGEPPAAFLAWRRMSQELPPPTTRPSRTRPRAPPRASSRCSCRSRRAIPRRPTTAAPGSRCAASRSPS